MSLYCLIHKHSHGSDAYLFWALDLSLGDGEIAARLGVNRRPFLGEGLTIAPITNVNTEDAIRCEGIPYIGTEADNHECLVDSDGNLANNEGDAETDMEGNRDIEND